MNTAPVTTALTDNGIALMPVTIGGVILPAGSTPSQRLEAHAKAGTQSQFHTDSTAARFAQGDGRAVAPGTIAGKAPPPTPKALEAANKPAPQGDPSAARQAEFDAEMQAKGLMARPDGSTHADGAVDPEVVEKLTARYRELHKSLIANQDDGPRKAERAQELREVFERDLKRAHEGRPLSEFEMRPDAPKPKAPKSAPPPVSSHSPQVWAEAHTSVADKAGWIPLNRINKDGLSGYSLPKFLEDQTYHVSIFQDLANARAQGISQKAVEGFIRAGMVQNGWLKA